MLGGQGAASEKDAPPMEGDPYLSPCPRTPLLEPPLRLQTCFSSSSLAFVFKSFDHETVKYMCK